jgi:ABC-type sugar transport system permease subunit
MTPALSVLLLVAVFPIAWTFWESLHLHDLRMPWLGQPFIGAQNYVEVLRDGRFWSAIAHSTFFASTAVLLELAGGLILALALHRQSRGQGLLRTAAVLPWAVPTVVVALIWRFLFDSPSGLVSVVIERASTVVPPTWFADATAAWIPLVLADVWKTTPFVGILLLAGLQNIDPALYDAAALDGAGRWRQLVHITLPQLTSAILVALIFRALDAFRVFDLIYVMTGGGPGTATEPIALYTFAALLRNLRFGFGAALAIIVFAIAFLLALGAVRAFGGVAQQGGAS